MVDDLIALHLHTGMTMDEVVFLLGRHDPDPYFMPDEWIYCLGTQRNSIIPLDNEWLLLTFDEMASVSSFELVTD